MTGKRRALFLKTPLMAVLSLAACLAMGAGSVGAAIQYLDDGGLQNGDGGWDLPAQGTCPADLTKVSRPDCVALRLNILQASCTSPNYSWNTSGVCNDLINTTQAACEAQPDRLWNPAPTGTDTCAIVMKGDDRNNVVCALHQGAWVTTGTCIGAWVMPARTAYTPNLLTATGPGDQCLRCHNSETQYNGPRVRDVEGVLTHGHKNMARKVTVGQPWGGPPFECTVPGHENEEDCEAAGGVWVPASPYVSDDSGNVFNWTTGQITIGGTPRDLTWIYGDWLAPLPRAIAKLPASSSQVCSDPRYTTATCVANGGTLLNNAGASYSCARCHTTGWTSDATINTATDIQGKEPELSFPGITWDRNSNAGFGVVNLSGGVSGDPNKYGSWDVYGIVCTRCHSSAIDPLSPVSPPETPPRYNAPTGMSSHHSVLTAPDVSTSGDKGYCTDSRFTAQAQCDAAGAAWLTQCSTAGVCSDPTYTTSGSCAANGGTWTKYVDQATCETNSGTWQATPACSVAGVCNTLNPVHSTQTLCEAAGGQWAAATDVVRCLDVHEYGKANGVASYASAGWTGSKTNRGQIITRLCMDCHRQETSGMPYVNVGTTPGTYDTVNPGMYVKVGPAHSSVAPVSHAHGNMFLNSPHGQFTGTFGQIATGTFKYDGSGLYQSFFQTEGEAANTGNGCTGCHNVHNSTVEGTGSHEGAFREECTECHAKNLNAMLHPKGGGTPLETMATEPAEACETCHMPEGLHFFRINSSPSYSTYPMPAALTGTVNANASPDGSFANAVWVDVDLACGQCHGGGTAQALTRGSITAATKVLTVVDATNFAAGERVRIAGAGALEADGVTREDFDTYVASVVGLQVTLAGNASGTVTNAFVDLNPTRNNAGYMPKAELATKAQGIHNDKPSATFGYRLGSPNTLQVDVDASATSCSGTCDAYDWDWGDGSAHGSGVTASHTYASAGTKAITLTVDEYGVGASSVTKNVTVYTPDLPPAASGTCGWLNANTWTYQVTDSSTDDNGIKQVTVNWGDGSLLSSDTTAPFGPFTRTYLNAGTYTITHKAIDTIGQQNTRTCTASPTPFTISGTVYRSNGTTPLPAAIVTLRRGGTVVKTVYTMFNGAFSAGSLRPGTYTLTVTKTGYTFADPAATITVGPNSAGNSISAVTTTTTTSSTTTTTTL